LDDGCVRREVGGRRVLSGRPGHRGGGVGHNINNVGGGTIVGNIGESKLDTFVSRQENGSSLSMFRRKVAVCLRSRLEPGIVDDKNVSASCWYTGDIDEVNVIVRQRHDGLIAGRVEGSFFDIEPGNSRRLGCGSKVGKAEIPQFADVRKGVEDVCVVVKNGREATWATSGTLDSP